MNKIKSSLISMLLITQIACVKESNIVFDKEHSVKKFSKEEKSNINKSYHQAKIWMKKRDLKKSEEEFEKILKIVPHNLYNDDYIFALLAKTKLYANFELLDKVQFTTLKACGLSDELANEITNACELKSKNNVKSIIKKLEKNIDKENYYGFHVAKSYLRTIFGLKESDDKYDKLRKKVKQGRYDLYLYPALLRFHTMKIKRTKQLDFLKEKLKKAKGNEAKIIEDRIASTYVYLGKFNKASTIADKFLAKDENDINSLYTKMNIAMSSGKYEEMKEYENRILKIKPNAFR